MPPRDKLDVDRLSDDEDHLDQAALEKRLREAEMRSRAEVLEMIGGECACIPRVSLCVSRRSKLTPRAQISPTRT